jgi:hypothetical protein
MLVSPPHEGRRCDAVLVATVWVADNGEVTMDFVVTPPQHGLDVLRSIRRMREDRGI